VKRAVVGYGRAEKPQVGQMVKLLLGMAQVPAPHDAADALAVALCHLHTVPHARAAAAAMVKDSRTAGSRSSVRTPRSWRDYRPPAGG
jgi:hypothetical protein